MSQNALVRLARWLGFGRNPLRRRWDRIEALARLAAVVALVVSGFLGTSTAIGTYARETRIAAEQAKGTFPATARLTSDPVAVPPGSVTPGGMPPSRVSAVSYAQATWQAPDGSPRQGVVPAKPAWRAGDSVPIRVDASGRPKEADRQHKFTVLSAVMMAVSFPIGAAAALWLLLLGLRALAERRTRQAWEAEWVAVEPRWRRRI